MLGSLDRHGGNANSEQQTGGTVMNGTGAEETRLLQSQPQSHSSQNVRTLIV
jgi:hypothetical protein